MPCKSYSPCFSRNCCKSRCSYISKDRLSTGFRLQKKASRMMCRSLRVYAYTTDRQKVRSGCAIIFDQRGCISKGVTLNDNTGEILFVRPGYYRIKYFVQTQCNKGNRFAIFLNRDANSKCQEIVPPTLARVDCSCKVFVVYEMFIPSGTSLTIRNAGEHTAIIPYGSVQHTRPAFIKIKSIRQCLSTGGCC